MTNEEQLMFRDLYRFYDTHGAPPDPQAIDVDWWYNTAQDLNHLALKHNNHPLMDKLLLGVYEYLEEKAKGVQR